MKTIKKLPQEVINRIAAGEVIQRPLSAIKELIENCIDANSSFISVMCIDGGFTSIEISDDGDGIDPIDFPLLCERFATSKINDFSDLMTINSFGFRGEALASISFVSHLTIKSKKKNAQLGFKASFRDGLMINETTESVTMNKGTIINVDKLFYNLEVRKNSTTNKDEFKEVLKLIHKISIHNYGIKFKLLSSLKTIEFSTCNLLSKGKEARLEIISNIFKINEKELIYIEENIPDYFAKVEAIFSQIGSVKKNREICIFINDRLVECEQVKKTIDNIYKEFWVSIHEDEGGYFCYISLNLRTDNIDVNVDPRKKIVKFIYEKEICYEIHRCFEEKLKEKCTIRTFQTASLPKNILDFPRSESNIVKKNENTDILSKKPRVSDKNLVRADPKTQKITSFMSYSKKNIEIEENEIKSKNDSKEEELVIGENNSLILNENNSAIEIISEILLEKKNRSDDETTKFFHNLTYIGCLNSNYILVQNNQKLLIINSIPFCKEIFWHKTIISIKKFDELKLQNELDIEKCLENMFIKNKINIQDQNKIKEKSKHILQSEKKLWEELFSIRISDGLVSSFPKLSPNLMPKIKDLEYFFFNVFSKYLIESSVKEKIKLISEEISWVYSWSLEKEEIFDESQKEIDEYFGLNLFPFMKKCCFFEKNEDFLKFSYNLLNLEDVYKIFERC